MASSPKNRVPTVFQNRAIGGRPAQTIEFTGVLWPSIPVEEAEPMKNDRLAVHRLMLLLLISMLSANQACAMFQTANYDESKVPKFELPPVLTTADGQVIESDRDWTETRRPEIVELFRQHVPKHRTMRDSTTRRTSP